MKIYEPIANGEKSRRVFFFFLELCEFTQEVLHYVADDTSHSPYTTVFLWPRFGEPLIRPSRSSAGVAYLFSQLHSGTGELLDSWDGAAVCVLSVLALLI